MPPAPPGASVCPACRRLIGLSEKACPFCGHRVLVPRRLRGPLSRLFSGSLSFSRMLVATYIAVTVALSLVSLRESDTSLGDVLTQGPSFGVLVAFGSLLPDSVLYGGEWWRLVNHTFLHGGVLHLFMNCLVLSIFGPIVEAVYGRARFVLLYLGFGVAAGSLTGWMHLGQPYSSVGASGAVFGLLGLLLVYSRRRKDMVGASLFQRLLFFVFLNGLVAISGLFPSTDHWAHAGGLFSGILAGLLVRPLDVSPSVEGPGVRLAAVLVLGLQLGCLGIGTWNVTTGGGEGAGVMVSAQRSWELYAGNLDKVMHLPDDLDPTEMARDARVLDRFTRSFEDAAAELEADGEDGSWLREFAQRQEVLHDLLRRRAAAPERRAVAWELRKRMAQAPPPWTLPLEVEPCRPDPRSAPSLRLASAQHDWTHYWRNLDVLASQDLDAAQRSQLAEVLDDYSAEFESVVPILRSVGQPVDWLEALLADQRSLHQGLRGDAGLPELRARLGPLQAAMSASPWPAP